MIQHVLATLLFGLAVTAQDKPNIVLVLGDDMGIDSVAAFNSDLGLKTPALDRLAKEGMAFLDAHSTSGVCSPTRYALLTGRYNWRSRLKRGIVGRWERPLLEAARITLPEMMRAQGYATACIGKWHLGWSWPKKGGGTTERLKEIEFAGKVKGGPIDHGFDSYFGDDVPNWPPYAWRQDDRILGKLTARMKRGAMVGVSAGPAVEDWDFRAVLAEYGKRVTDYVRGRKDAAQPFFLYFPMPSPHTPIAPHEAFRGKTGVSEYADFLVQTDAVVGQLLETLDETGLAANTIVIFTCDNGTSPKAGFARLEKHGVHLRKHWRGHKADVYEGGHRVPFLVRWPGLVQAGSRYAHPISLVDVMATCAEISGFELPPNAGEDSVSLLPTLRAKHPDPVHEVIVHHSGGGHFAIRRGRWKLLLCRGSGGWSAPREAVAKKRGLPAVQLYDLEADPKESKNLQAEHPELVRSLTADLRRVIERGRSTPGPEQANHGGQSWWQGLPWPRSTRR